jgi:hypothetical protein
MMTQSEIQARIDSVKQPNGYNSYAWQVAKQTAWEAWQCYISGKPFRKNLNYFCREFYTMLQKPDGTYIVPGHLIRTLS